LRAFEPARESQTGGLFDHLVGARQHYRAGAVANVHRPAPIIIVAMPSFIVDPA
jgi:hypothetical protein